MGKFIVNAIRTICILSLFAGFFLIVAAFGAHGDIGYCFDGIGVIFASIISYGFSYVVEAASVYLSKSEQEE